MVINVIVDGCSGLCLAKGWGSFCFQGGKRVSALYKVDGKEVTCTINNEGERDR